MELRERCDNGLQRFNCVPCAVRLGQQFAMFTDWTSAIFEESKLRPLEWLLVIGLWQLKLNATAIAPAADPRNGQRRGGAMCWMVASTRRTIWTHRANWNTKWKRMSATRVRVVKGCPESNATTAHRDHAGCSCAVAPPPSRAVHPLLGLVQRRDKTDPDAPAAQLVSGSPGACAHRDHQTPYRCQGERRGTVLH